MKFKLPLMFIFFGMVFGLKAQQTAPPLVYNENPIYNITPYSFVDKTIEGADTISLIYLKPIIIFKNKVDMRTYERLVRNIKIVYPIAKYANFKLNEMEYNLKSISSKRDQDKYVKQTEKELKDAYSPILKRMSFSQGKILIKLIDRQTGHTSYDLVKDLRGGFSAFLWQGVAKMFGANLKDRYDKDGEDLVIEKLIILYEAGQL